MKGKYKSEIKLSDDKSVASVTYRFRGLAEAGAFKVLVDNILILSDGYFEEAGKMDEYCRKNGCEEL